MNRPLTIGAACTGSVLVGWIVFQAWQNRRDKRASAFLQVVREHIIPGEIGDLKKTAFNPGYREVLAEQGKTRLFVLPKAEAHALADKIENAFGLWDNEKKIYGIIDGLKDKLAISQVAKAYQGNEERSLLDRLRGLDEDEFEIIKKKVQTKPNYRQA